jgi:GNAT superfamily N-acetyltransferase
MALTIDTATPSDAEAAFHLINDAYHIETGDIPPAFKLTTRFLLPAELQPLLASGRVLAARGAGGALLGVLSYDLHRDPATGALRAHFGPFAVAAAAQGAGTGRALLGELAARARAAGCASLDAEVVNHRHDLFPLYLGRLGFRVVGAGPFTAPDRLSRPAHFVLIRKAL